MPAKKPSATALRQGPLTGREINMQWLDGKAYPAIVVSYTPSTNKYNIIYKKEGSFEEIDLSQTPNWSLVPPRKPKPGKPVLEGAIVEFFVPTDRKMQYAMVFKHLNGGRILKVAFLDASATMHVKSSAWKFVSRSPCLMEGFPVSLEDDGVIVEAYLEEQENAKITKEKEAGVVEAELTDRKKDGNNSATASRIEETNSGHPLKDPKGVSKGRIEKPSSLSERLWRREEALRNNLRSLFIFSLLLPVQFESLVN